jgi:hypothetical protein
MKKQVKKLVLSRETLRTLEDQDGLKQAAGGLTVVTGCNYCVTGSCPDRCFSDPVDKPGTNQGTM